MTTMTTPSRIRGFIAASVLSALGTSCGAAPAPAAGRGLVDDCLQAAIAAALPPGSRIVAAASGDFDGDGRPDAVAVVEQAGSEPDDGTPILLVVLRGRAAGDLAIEVSSEAVAWPHNAGMRGESGFESLRSDGRTFTVVNFEQDSNKGRLRTLASRFRRLHGGWTLVEEQERWTSAYSIPESDTDRACPALRLPSSEACVGYERIADLARRRTVERWTIDAAQDEPARKPRTVVRRSSSARLPLRLLVDIAGP